MKGLYEKLKQLLKEKGGELMRNENDKRKVTLTYTYVEIGGKESKISIPDMCNEFRQHECIRKYGWVRIYLLHTDRICGAVLKRHESRP